MYYLYVKNGRFVTVIVSHRGVCFADICPRPHRVSVDTGQASRCPLKRPVTVRLEVVQKPYFSYYYDERRNLFRYLSTKWKIEI